MSQLIKKFLNSGTGGTLIRFVLAKRYYVFVGSLCVVIIYLFLVLLSYNEADIAWSHYNSEMLTTTNITNIGGAVGAWIADVLHTFFGVGAWLSLLLVGLEALMIRYNTKRIALPLRLIVYGFLWVCACIILYALGDWWTKGVANLGGVIGREVHLALASLMGAAFTVIFAVVTFLLVGLLFVEFDRPITLSKTNKRHKNDKSIFKEITQATSTSSPLDIPKHQSVRQGSLLENFLVNSGLRDELTQPDEQDEEKLAQKESEAQSVTIAHATIAHATIHANTIHQTVFYGEQASQNTALNNGTTHNSPVVSDTDTAVFESIIQDTNTQATKNPAVSKNAFDGLSLDGVSLGGASFKNSTPFDDVILVDEGFLDTPIVSKNGANQEPADDLSSWMLEQEDNQNHTPAFSLSQDDDKEAIFLDLDIPNIEQSLANDPKSTTKNDVESLKVQETQINPASNAAFDELTLDIENDGDNPPIKKPDILDDVAFVGKSLAMQTAAYRASLTPIPSLELLDKKTVQTVGYSPAELIQLSELLEIKLKEFGVNASVMNVVQGPIVTSFEVELAAGVKASKVTNISQDLARSLSMVSLRVVEVIAGKPYIGIEIPNKAKETVKLIELLNSPDYQTGDNQIAMAMGKDIGGNVVIADLAKAPHMLVAGTTGSGKSVLVNAMLLSMLLKYTPEELRLILIDPKMLELANYGDIPHLLTPVVTDMTEAASALSWCVGEMERRYQLMALLKVRKISEFNKKVKDATDRGEPILDPLWRPNDSVSVDKAPKLKPLPLIVVVADEFADMMMQVGKQAEELITRLAQKSRAAGIHLMLATQRPSVDVITGLIKANIPSRAALRVNSKVDSRTILDSGGAEDMLGHGDMLFLAPGKNEPIRVHGAYVTDDEVNRVTDAWRERGAPEYIDTVTSALNFPDGGEKSKDGLDELYDEAFAFVVESGKTSISSLQRHLKIGYNRAANIIESMQEQGVLSAPDNSGKRSLLL